MHTPVWRPTVAQVGQEGGRVGRSVRAADESYRIQALRGGRDQGGGRA